MAARLLKIRKCTRMADKILRRNNSMNKTHSKESHKSNSTCKPSKISLKLIKEIQFSKQKFSKSLETALGNISSIFQLHEVNLNDSYNNPVGSFQETSCNLLKLETVFTKLRADFCLVDSLMNLLIKSCIGKDHSLPSERRGKKSSSKDVIKRTKSEKLHSKHNYQLESKVKSGIKPMMNLKVGIRKATDSESIEVDTYKLPNKIRRSFEKTAKGGKKHKSSYCNPKMASSFKKSSNVYKTLHNGALETIKGGRSKRNTALRNGSIQYFGSYKPKMKQPKQNSESFENTDFKKQPTSNLGRCSSNKQMARDTSIEKILNNDEPGTKPLYKIQVLTEAQSKKLQSERPSNPKGRSKHRRNKSIFTTAHPDSGDKENKDICKRVLETMQRAQSQPKQAKVQMVDDFSEDIQILAGNIEKEQQKENFRKQFTVPNNLGNAQLGNFVNSCENSQKDLAKIEEEVEGYS